VGNVGDNSVSSYRLYASETQQPSYVPITVADATPVCYLSGVVRGSRQPVTGQLATQRLRYTLFCTKHITQYEPRKRVVTIVEANVFHMQWIHRIQVGSWHLIR